MAKYRKKPVVVDAFQLPEKGDECFDPFYQWAEEVGLTNYRFSGEDVWVGVDKHSTVAEPGDWIVKGAAGNFYSCSSYDFPKIYKRTVDY